MAYQVCHIHNSVSAWGCPKCRKEDLRADMERAAEETVEAMRKAFREALPTKDNPHD